MGKEAELQKEIVKREGLIFSEATLKTDDLLATTYSLLQAFELNEKLQKEIRELFTGEEPTERNLFYSDTKLMPDKEEEANNLLNEDIFNYFNEIAPEGYYFGTLEGDGACFGFWKNEEE